MNHRSQRLKFRETTLWKRIFERHKFRGRLLRTRAPLVFLRLGLPRDDRRPRLRARHNGHPVSLNLYFHLSWPQWLASNYGPRVAVQNSSFSSTVTSSSVTRELKWLLGSSKNINSPVISRTITQLAAAVVRNPRRIEPGSQEAKRVFAISKRDRGAPVNGIASQTVASAPAIRRGLGSIARNPRNAATVVSSPFTLVNNQLYNLSNERNVFELSKDSTVSPAEKVERTIAPKSTAQETTVLRQSSRTDVIDRAFLTNIETRRVAGPAIQPQLVHRVRADKTPESSRARLYTEPPPLTFVNQPRPRAPERTQPHEQEPLQAARAATPVIQPVQPQLDMNRLSDEVYRHIQRKLRVERERRGL